MEYIQLARLSARVRPIALSVVRKSALLEEGQAGYRKVEPSSVKGNYRLIDLTDEESPSKGCYPLLSVVRKSAVLEEGQAGYRKVEPSSVKGNYRLIETLGIWSSESQLF
jgi:hypothetical protein